MTLIEIISAMRDLIAAIPCTGTNAHMFHIDTSGTANYPAPLITFSRQVSDNKDAAMQRGFVNTEIQIKLITDTSSATLAQNDEALDIGLSALKAVFQINNGYYSLGNGDAILTYMGFDKDIAANGDVFSPGYLITKWNVLHRE